MVLYFLDGLGSNECFTTGLSRALAAKGIAFHYLTYPDTGFSSLEHLREWFGQYVKEEKITLMGFSLGADFATYLANQFPQINRLIVLDGGLTVHPIDSVPLEKEIDQALAYLRASRVSDMTAFLEQEEVEASVWPDFMAEALLSSYVYDGNSYRLKLSESEVSSLLRTRRACFEVSREQVLAVKTLVCLAGQPADYCREKVLRLRDYDGLAIHVCQTAAHNLYLEAESELVGLIQEFLEAND